MSSALRVDSRWILAFAGTTTPFVAAVAALRTREAVGEDAALQVAAELTLDTTRVRRE